MNSTRVLALVALIGGSLLASTSVMPVASAQTYSIAVDPGHGGSDPGGLGCGLQEKSVNLQMSLHLRDLLEADPDLSVLMTRTTDVFISLQGRCDIANDAGVDRFASVHSNSFDGPAHGIETYCYTSGSATSFAQRDAVHAAMIAAWPLTDRGVKTANFHVVKYTAMPATLSELAFITYCDTDATYLGSDTHLQEAAAAHHQALRSSLGLGEVVTPTNGTLQGVVFEDQGVGLDDTSVRLPGAQVTVKDDGGATIDSAIATSPSGGWSFTVAPGEYTVIASSSGYITAERTCSVGSGGTTWCSVGLNAEVVVIPDNGPADAGAAPMDAGSPFVDVGTPAPDAGVPTDVGPIALEDLGPSGSDDVNSDTTGSGAADNGSTGQDDTDGSPAVIDAGSTDTGGGTGAGQEDAGPATVDAGSDGSQSDASGPVLIGEHNEPLKQIAAADPGCSSTGRGHSGAWVIVVGLLLLLGRRRLLRVAAPVLALVSLTIGCNAEPMPNTPAAVAQQPAPVAVWSLTESAVTDAAPISLTATRVPQSEGLTSPETSPDGSKILATSSTFDRLVVLEDGTRRDVVQTRRCGWAARWEDDETIAYRTPDQPMHAVPLLSARLDGKPAAPPTHRSPGRWVRIVDEEVQLTHSHGSERLSPEGDRFCCARQDGSFAVFQGATTGAWVVNLESERRYALGAGHHPRVSPDGRWAAFDRSTDDGDNVTSSEVVLVDLNAGTRHVLAQHTMTQHNTTQHKMARWPSFSSDGRLVFEADGALWIAPLP